MTRPFLHRPESPRSIEEVRHPGPVPTFLHPDWRSEFPWLLQGITAGPFDLRLFGPDVEAGSIGKETVLARWDALRRELGQASVVHAPQVHGIGVLQHDHASPGLRITPPADGHLTALPGLVLTISVADCVPIYLVDPVARVIGLLHAGWRGVAGRILSAALAALNRRWGTAPGEVRVHLGPAICGSCYEVGPEVHRALARSEPPGPAPVDLREVLLEQAHEAGVPFAGLSVSTHCTRCQAEAFFSHRAGSGGRQMAFLAIRGGGQGVG